MFSALVCEYKTIIFQNIKHILITTFYLERQNYVLGLQNVNRFSAQYDNLDVLDVLVLERKKPTRARSTAYLLCNRCPRSGQYFSAHALVQEECAVQETAPTFGYLAL